MSMPWWSWRVRAAGGLTWILKRSFAWFDVKGRGQRLDDTPLIRMNLCLNPRIGGFRYCSVVVRQGVGRCRARIGGAFDSSAAGPSLLQDLRQLSCAPAVSPLAYQNA